MERSSSRKDLKAERLAQSPYSRPSPKPFSTLRSLVSYVSSPFRSSPSLPTHLSKPPLQITQDEAIDVDKNSESGSEDRWEGSAPERMEGKDVFDLAQAGGRNGSDFDKRAEGFRGEISGGRREIARVQAGSSFRPSPSMPSLNMLSRTNGTLPPRTPLPAFSTARDSRPPSSPSSAALSAFLDAKMGQPLGPEDRIVIETLTESLKAESTPSGWSAGTYSRSTPSRPAPIAPSTPGVDFAVGISAGPSTPMSATPRRKMYLGPGMSPRRLLPKKEFKPLFDLETMGKKRRVEDQQVDSPGTAGSSKPYGQVAVPLPSPSLSEKQSRAEKEGKRSAMDIMNAIISEELGTHDIQPEPVIVNPYESPVKPTSDLGKSTSSTPRRSILRSSIRGTPSRGAAEKLERHKVGRKLTTLETLRGDRNSPTKHTPSKLSQTPIEIDELSDDSASPEPTPKEPTPEPTLPQIPEPIVIPPFVPPTVQTTSFSSPSIPKPSFVPYIPYTSAVAPKPESKTYVPPDLSAYKPTKPEEPISTIEKPTPTETRQDTSKVYLSPKDSALKVSKLALPFYTFTLPTLQAHPDKTILDRVLEIPSTSLPVYNFTLSPAPVTFSTIAAAQKQPTNDWTCTDCMLKNPPSAKEKCTICEAPRPSSSLPEPAQPMLKAQTNKGFDFAAAGMAVPKSTGGWICGICGLTNQDGTDKCFVCETPR